MDRSRLTADDIAGAIVRAADRREFFVFGHREAGVAYSHDGGETWTFPGVLEPGQFRSDPVLAADSTGTFFYYSLSTTTTAEMFISGDAGVTWMGPIDAQGGDKTWMTADATGGLGDGNLYAIWNSQFTCCAAGTDFTRSTDGGLSYLGPLALPDKPKWGTVAVGPDGEVYVVGTRTTPFSFPDAHLIQKSSDAADPGVTPTFGAAVGFDRLRVGRPDVADRGGRGRPRSVHRTTLYGLSHRRGRDRATRSHRDERRSRTRTSARTATSGRCCDRYRGTVPCHEHSYPRSGAGRNRRILVADGRLQ